MAAGAIVLVASREKSLELFYVAFIALFVLSGVGDGSTDRMIPAIFRNSSGHVLDAGADPDVVEHESRRKANAVIGIPGSVGAFGGVLVTLRDAVAQLERVRCSWRIDGSAPCSSFQ